MVLSKAAEAMQIANYMAPNLVAFLNAATRDETLSQLVNMVDRAGKLPDRDAFLKAIIEREKIISTGVGMGIAIPHAKLSTYNHFFIAIGILQKPVEWDSLDRAPVRLVFMIGGPDDKQTEYLQILSQLTRAIKDEDRRKKLLNSQNADAIVELFKVI